MSLLHVEIAPDRVAANVRRRRVPSQARSRERVQRLIDTADSLIGANGFATLTVPLLAARAEVPVGTVYQFFPDKGGIVDAVADRYMGMFVESLGQVVDRIVELRWETAVEQVVEHFADMYRQHTTFRELWLNGHLSLDARERDRRNNDEFATVLTGALKQRPEFHRTRKLRLACRTAVEVADALLRYAFTLSPSGDQATINELKRILSVYLLRYATLGPAQRQSRTPVPLWITRK